MSTQELAENPHAPLSEELKFWLDEVAIESSSEDCPCVASSTRETLCKPDCYHRTGEGNCLLCDGTGITRITQLANVRAATIQEMETK